LGTPGDPSRRLLLEYGWPGNVRELRHVVEALVVSGRDGEVVDEGRVMEFLEAASARDGSNCTSGDVRRGGVERALEASGGNKAEAARRLGISRKTLYQKLRDLRIG
jgi:two-component system, NtrC family, response regulator HydG